MTIKVEICLDSVESAVAAQTGGADRIELCDNLVQGGTTPSFGMVKQVRQMINIGLMVMLRPRGGDFLYSDHEFAVMRSDLQKLSELDVDGIVFGCLNSDGTVNKTQATSLINLAKKKAKPLSVTFHRAFDMARDPFETLEELRELGVDRILTSGQAPNATAGAELIGRLQKTAGPQLTILPAVGINAQNGAELVRTTGVREVHIGSGAHETIQSQMTHKNKLAQMGAGAGDSEFEIRRASAKLVKSIVQTLKEVTREK